ncbi:hypothetical protein [Pseudomonas syringae group genomosp. 3]|uniref:hypothetical protein n=1 Tax=Pseudomonas syringae group genomosp. 3 TaxID=251701 RepID=UPI001ABA43B9|nr:hypothetical protein [Pseudomonas syringae group genomosp. 3]
MTVDIEKMEALAKAAIEQESRWKDAGEPWPVWNKSLLEMQAAANPAAVLELIADQKRMVSRMLCCTMCGGQGEVYSGRTSYEGYNQPPEPIMDKCGECDGAGVLGDEQDCLSILDELEQVKAENAGLKTGYEAYERVNAELRAECEALRVKSARYEWLKQNATVMLKNTVSYTTSLGLMQTCYPSAIEMDTALDVAMSPEEAQ